MFGKQKRVQRRAGIFTFRIEFPSGEKVSLDSLRITEKKLLRVSLKAFSPRKLTTNNRKFTEFVNLIPHEDATEAKSVKIKIDLATRGKLLT